jgi:hypothetical protein
MAVHFTTVLEYSVTFNTDERGFSQIKHRDLRINL